MIAQFLPLYPVVRLTKSASTASNTHSLAQTGIPIRQSGRNPLNWKEFHDAISGCTGAYDSTGNHPSSAGKDILDRCGGHVADDLGGLVRHQLSHRAAGLDLRLVAGRQ